jgi:type 1 glutamine amidotransferase
MQICGSQLPSRCRFADLPSPREQTQPRSLIRLFSSHSQIQLSDSEFVKEVSGTFAVYAGVVTVIKSIKLVTNLKTYGPFGQETGTSFSVPVQGNNGVAGFFGRSGTFLDAIGVYVHPL